MDDTTAKRAKLQHQYPVDNDEENEDSEGSQDSADGDLEPEEALSPMHHPMMKLVLHELTHGGMVLPLSASSGCKYRVAVGGDLPSHGVVRGVLHLEDVPGAHLDYSVSFEVGVMLEAELYDIADGVTPGFRRAARVMDIFETYVPPAERGKGHARRLAQAAFAVAHAYGYLVRPSCSYIADTFLAATPTITDWPMEKATGCDELLLFTCSPEGKGLEEFRRALASLAPAALKARCKQEGTKISGSKPILIERLVGARFGRVAARREERFRRRAKCREYGPEVWGCTGCLSCTGEREQDEKEPTPELNLDRVLMYQGPTRGLCLCGKLTSQSVLRNRVPKYRKCPTDGRCPEERACPEYLHVRAERGGSSES